MTLGAYTPQLPPPSEVSPVTAYDTGATAQRDWPCPLQEEPQVIAEGLTRRELPTFDQLRDHLTFEAE